MTVTFVFGPVSVSGSECAHPASSNAAASTAVSTTGTDRGKPIIDLNELEYIHGEIYANVWHTDRIARISPATGRVVGWIDLKGLMPRSRLSNDEAVLNGIAYDAAHNRLFVTGKLWPSIFEITLIPEKAKLLPIRHGK